MTHVLNSINPNSIRMMSLAVKKDSALMENIENGSYFMLSETEMVKEQRQLIEQLAGIHSHYGNFHGINLLTEIDGVLPEDKRKLLSIIDEFLSLSEDLQENFIFGRRIGRYGCLAGFQDSPSFNAVQQHLENLQGESPGALESIFHDLRKRVI